MTNEELTQLYLQDPRIKKVEVTGDGHHFNLLIVSDEFMGLSKLKRQQWVYSKCKELIASGDLHALNMTTFTEQEWETAHG